MGHTRHLWPNDLPSGYTITIEEQIYKIDLEVENIHCDKLNICYLCSKML